MAVEAGARECPGSAFKDLALVEVIKRNWALEMDGSAMYAGLAQRDRIPERRAVFTKLSELERKHADEWARRLQELGQSPPSAIEERHSSRPSRAPGGIQDWLRDIEEDERRDVSNYLKQLHEIDDEETRAILRQVILDEFTHAHVLQRMYAQSSPHSAMDYLARRQRQGTGSWIGDAVYGVNDGLGAIFGIVSGVSGATLGNSHVVLLAGVAGMVASALSMGAGAYLAAKSEKEIYQAELQRERLALEENPESAREELSIFYQLKGVPEADAHKIADYLSTSADQFLRTMAAEKLNLTEDALSSPIRSAITGSVSTAVGAFIPVVPFFFMSGYPAVIAAAVVSLIAHFAVGAAKSMVTVRSWWSSGWEMTLVGAVEGIVTYFVGIALGRVGA